jgi:hypothetical protein
MNHGEEIMTEGWWYEGWDHEERFRIKDGKGCGYDVRWMYSGLEEDWEMVWIILHGWGLLVLMVRLKPS